MTSVLAAIGIGNTSVKFGRLPHASSDRLPQWSHLRELPTREFQPAELATTLSVEPHRWVVASVQRASEQRLRDWVRDVRPQDEYRLLNFRDLPLVTDVEAPDRVGMDRLAAAIAVNRMRTPDRPAIFVDAGTALTVNLVTADGVFRGGVIMPGFKLTTQALAAGTDLLPLIIPDLTAEPPAVVGRSTEAAIRSGLFWGSVGAVRELITRMTPDSPTQPDVFVTGGDASRLAGFLSSTSRFVPDLVLIGIATSDATLQRD